MVRKKRVTTQANFKKTLERQKQNRVNDSINLRNKIEEKVKILEVEKNKTIDFINRLNVTLKENKTKRIAVETSILILKELLGK